MSDDAILAAMARLETRLATRDELVSLRIDLTLRMDRLDLTSRMDRLETGLNGLRGECGGFREQVLDRLTAIREDIGVNMARVDRVANANADVRAELVDLRKENTALWRMLKALEARVNQIDATGS